MEQRNGLFEMRERCWPSKKKQKNARIKAGLLLWGDSGGRLLLRCHTTDERDRLRLAMATRLDKLCCRVFCVEGGDLASQQPQAP
ncbi:uncharacterized protein TrAFT101_002415 [Trichoderma asperellum]|uniref:uncharacterized protein n=1 Tax=Trichoderma asperellum TaxID=101201 RepID=UPI00332CA39E|nr:hypothetical protein TrAFT101_002415 [Trichoderma asperellum]